MQPARGALSSKPAALLGGGAMRQIDSPTDPALRPMRAVSKGENMTIKNVSVKMWPVGSHG